MTEFFRSAPRLITAEEALPDSRHPVLPTPGTHLVLGAPLTGPWPEGTRELIIGMGCYWGAERLFWETDGVVCTSVGFAGGYTANPTYRETCTGRTGHSEVVHIAYDPERVTAAQLIRIALENHDPTQGMRQGADIGTQYRSVIFTLGPTAEEDLVTAQAAIAAYQPQLTAAGYGRITTQVARLRDTPAGAYFLAEEEHQQYLEKNPRGYCPIHATGVTFSATDQG